MVGFLFSFTFAEHPFTNHQTLKTPMKKIAICLSFLLTIFSTVQAQWQLGVRGGVQSSFFYTESNVMNQQNPGIGYELGVFGQYKMGAFAFQPGLRFSNRTLCIEDANDKFYLSRYANLDAQHPRLQFSSNFIELPLSMLLKIKMKETKLLFEAGPQFSYRLNGAFNGETDDFQAYDEAMPFRNFDIGLGLGTGLEINNVVVGLRWDWYLNRMGKQIVNDISNTGEGNVFHQMKYNNLQLTVGYLF